MNNRHLLNHSADRHYKAGQLSSRFNNHSLDKGMRQRLQDAVENLDMADKDQEYHIRSSY